MNETIRALPNGDFVVRLGKQERRATVFEDVDSSEKLVRFEGVERVQRLDEIDRDATFTPVNETSE